MSARSSTPWSARGLIVDDEPIARRGLRQLLTERGDLEIIGECANGDDAVRMIRRERPDIVYLDIQMPGLDGFDVLRTIGVNDMPCVVFVTAFDEHALRAFAVAATDYVVKPFSPERLAEATDRALRRIRERRVVAAHEQLLHALGDAPASSPLRHDDAEVPGASYATRLLVSVGARSVVVPLHDVNLFEADGYYVTVRTGTAQYTLRESLTDLESRVSPLEFLRVHRSAIVRISAVKCLERVEPERLVVVLADGRQIPVSRGRRDLVIRTLGSIRG